jgi:hypothetical protein
MHSAASAATTTTRFKPWTRTEDLPEVSVAMPSGYTPAYYRKRKNLAVLRAYDNSHYLVFNTASGESARVGGTREASELMSAVRRGLMTLEGHVSSK